MIHWDKHFRHYLTSFWSFYLHCSTNFTNKVLKISNNVQYKHDFVYIFFVFFCSYNDTFYWEWTVSWNFLTSNSSLQILDTIILSFYKVTPNSIHLMHYYNPYTGWFKKIVKGSCIHKFNISWSLRPEILHRATSKLYNLILQMRWTYETSKHL